MPKVLSLLFDTVQELLILPDILRSQMRSLCLLQVFDILRFQ